MGNYQKWDLLNTAHATVSLIPRHSPHPYLHTVSVAMGKASLVPRLGRILGMRLGRVWERGYVTVELASYACLPVFADELHV